MKIIMNDDDDDDDDYDDDDDDNDDDDYDSGNDLEKGQINLSPDLLCG